MFDPEIPFSEIERRVLRVLPFTSPADWASQHRILSRRQSARPGLWRHDLTPYLYAIMDCCGRSEVEQISVMKAAQAGGSESIRNVIGWMADRQPDPILLVLPDETTGRKVMTRRIIPLIQDTPVLSKLQTETRYDLQARTILLRNGFTLTLGWSGSPTSLAVDPVRVCVLDEVDKFQAWTGAEGAPIDLARLRTQTYGERRLIIALSTPTNRDGAIAGLWDEADVQLSWHVACPKCQALQAFSWPQVRWEIPEEISKEPSKRAAYLRQYKLVWYECIQCGERWTERERGEAIRGGVWASQANRPQKAEAQLAEWAADHRWQIYDGLPERSHVAFHISAMMCSWVRLSDMAAEFVLSQHNVARLFAFMTGWLGEPFEQQVSRPEPGTFTVKAQRSGAQPGAVPKWAKIVLATADIQKDHLWYVVRAWGPRYRSQRIAHGRFASLADLGSLLNVLYSDGGNDRMRIAKIGIDAGYRTKEVYQFALGDPRVVLLKGESAPQAKPIRLVRATYKPPNRPDIPTADLWVHRIDTQHYKDHLTAFINAEMIVGEGETVDIWALDSVVDPEYNRQMVSEHKVLVRKGRSLPIQRWQPISSGAPNHYWDCETYQIAMADIVRLDLLGSRPTSPSRVGPPPVIERKRESLFTGRPPVRRKYD